MSASSLGHSLLTGLWARPQVVFPAQLFQFLSSVQNPGRAALGGLMILGWASLSQADPWQAGGDWGLCWRGGAGVSVRAPSPAPGLCSSPCPVPPKCAQGRCREQAVERGRGRRSGGRSAARVWTRSTQPSSRRSAAASSSCASACRRRTASSRRTSRRSRMTATTGRCGGLQPCVPAAAPQPRNAEPRTGRGLLAVPLDSRSRAAPSGLVLCPSPFQNPEQGG